MIDKRREKRGEERLKMLSWAAADDGGAFEIHVETCYMVSGPRSRFQTVLLPRE